MWRRSIKPGDCVVYRKLKQTTHPGPRARAISASLKGDFYSYLVDKFWVVRQELANGKLLVETRRGKTHVIDKRDPNLRRATLWDWLRHRARFAQLQRPRPADAAGLQHAR